MEDQNQPAKANEANRQLWALPVFLGETKDTSYAMMPSVLSMDTQKAGYHPAERNTLIATLFE